MGAALNSNVQIDPESEVPIQDQLRDILIENAVRTPTRTPTLTRSLTLTLAARHTHREPGQG